MTAPAYEPPYSGAEFQPPRDVPQPFDLPVNPQLRSLLALLGLKPLRQAEPGASGHINSQLPVDNSSTTIDQASMPLADSEHFKLPLSSDLPPEFSASAPAPDPAEIDLE